MSNTTTVTLPDIGDFDEVEVIEVLVKENDTLNLEDSIITVESDKASMEIPTPHAGVVSRILVEVGSKVSQGTPVLTLDVSDRPERVIKPAAPPTDTHSATAPPQPATVASENLKYDIETDVVVLGAGPGGYTAAFRAADLGKSVVLIERYPTLGGVCLNVGCIPSKALLHTAQVINETQTMSPHGVTFAKPKIDLDKLRGFKEKVISQLTGGLKGLAKQRKVQVVHGHGIFTSTHTAEVENNGEHSTIRFQHAIIAAGSQSIKIPGLPYHDERLMDSTSALALVDIPQRLLVIGGGIIGLEMATVYDALGAEVSVVELGSGLMPGCDRDLVRPLEKRLKKCYKNIFLNAKVKAIDSTPEGLVAHFEGDKAPEKDTFDRILLSVGRMPNGNKIGAEAIGINVDERGFIWVDKQQRTSLDHIFAIGDIVGQPMLAHKATHEAKIAAEAICGIKAYFDAKTIPSVAYTDPEIAWMGLTETRAKEEGIPYEKGVFPWAASGRSLSIDRKEGVTKVLFDPETKQILGAGMVGPNAGELIAEAVLALEMSANVEDVALTIHPHPTLSETLNFACEVAEGTCTDIYVPRK